MDKPNTKENPNDGEPKQIAVAKPLEKNEEVASFEPQEDVIAIDEPSNSKYRDSLWKRMLIEIPPVVIAVLLAFIINNAWSARQSRKAVEQSLMRINSELSSNVSLYKRMIELDSANLVSVREQIDDLSKDGYNSNFQYGEATNRFILNEGAWQAAAYDGSISNFDSEKIEQLSNIYTLIHFRNLAHSSVLPPSYDLYLEEALMPYLKENEVVIEDHLAGLRYEYGFIKEYLNTKNR